MVSYEKIIETSRLKIRDLKAFLAATDYLPIRESEGGEPCPVEKKEARAEARTSINELEATIADAQVKLETARQAANPVRE